MKRIIQLLIALTVATAAHAEQSMVARSPGGDTVRLTHKPCAIAAHHLFPGGVPPQFEGATSTISGQTFAACWDLLPSGVVLLIYEDGDVGELPAAAFRPDGA